MQSGLPGCLLERIIFCYPKRCDGNLISGCRLACWQLLPGLKFPLLPGSSQDRCVSLSSAALMSVKYAQLCSLRFQVWQQRFGPAVVHLFPLMIRQLVFDSQLDWLNLPAAQVTTEQLLRKLKLPVRNEKVQHVTHC